MKLLLFVSLIAASRALSFGKTNSVVRTAVPLTIDQEPISPYAFSYSADATDGASKRQESKDANGVVRGSYSLATADGIQRVVNYIADENGFRAQVDTNEPGTESKSSADVTLKSSQLPAEEIALKFGPRPDELVGLKTVKPLEVQKKIETPIRLLSKISPLQPIFQQKEDFQQKFF